VFDLRSLALIGYTLAREVILKLPALPTVFCQ